MLPTRLGSPQVSGMPHMICHGGGHVPVVVHQDRTSSGRSISCWRVPASGLSSCSGMEIPLSQSTQSLHRIGGRVPWGAEVEYAYPRRVRQPGPGVGDPRRGRAGLWPDVDAGGDGCRLETREEAKPVGAGRWTAMHGGGHHATSVVSSPKLSMYAGLLYYPAEYMAPEHRRRPGPQQSYIESEQAASLAAQ